MGDLPDPPLIPIRTFVLFVKKGQGSNFGMCDIVGLEALPSDRHIFNCESGESGNAHEL
jgi:hypothetical protein